MVDLLDQYYQVNPPPTHADNDDDSLYNDLVADRDREIAFRQAQGVDPDKTARANVLARQRGVPAPIVDGNLAAMEAQERAQKNAAIIKAYPAIGRWSADPRNSASAADDYEALGRIGATIKRKVEADKADFITGSGFFDHESAKIFT